MFLWLVEIMGGRCIFFCLWCEEEGKFIFFVGDIGELKDILRYLFLFISSDG